MRRALQFSLATRPRTFQGKGLVTPQGAVPGPARRLPAAMAFMYLNPYHQMDEARRRLGQYLDALGLGSLGTPFEVAFVAPGLTLRRYSTQPSKGPLLLIVPAPIKRPYIWDALPHASVVQRCLRNGIRVYLVAWERPGKAEQGLGLAAYADRLLLDCVRVIQDETGEARVFLVGHSLGGTFAAIFSSLHSDLVNGLIVMGAPTHFGEQVGLLGPVTGAGPNVKLVTAAMGNIPGSFLDVTAFAASPMTFGWAKWADWVKSLTDLGSVRTHLFVERWALDEVPMARRLFEDVLDLLYRENRFMRRQLTVNGRLAAPQSVDAPLISVIDRHCAIVPPEAMVPFHEAVPNPDKAILWYRGDTGVAFQHVGMLVGTHAHRVIWPHLIRWLHGHS